MRLRSAGKILAVFVAASALAGGFVSWRILEKYSSTATLRFERVQGMPYVGKWKANLAKSDYGQTTMALASLPGGEWESSAFGVTYKFKMDGKD